MTIHCGYKIKQGKPSLSGLCGTRLFFKFIKKIVIHIKYIAKCQLSSIECLVQRHVIFVDASGSNLCDKWTTYLNQWCELPLQGTFPHGVSSRMQPGY